MSAPAIHQQLQKVVWRDYVFNYLLKCPLFVVVLIQLYLSFNLSLYVPSCRLILVPVCIIYEIFCFFVAQPGFVIWIEFGVFVGLLYLHRYLCGTVTTYVLIVYSHLVIRTIKKRMGSAIKISLLSYYAVICSKLFFLLFHPFQEPLTR